MRDKAHAISQRHAPTPRVSLRSRAPALIALCACVLLLTATATATELPYTQVSQAAVSIESASPAARDMAAWIIGADDNQGRPFLIVDKVDAQVLAFNTRGELIATAPVLLGVTRGDDSPPGIGERALSDIDADMRITPAGRFDATLGVNLAGTIILWLDYDAALSLHAVVTGGPSDRRLHRLGTATTLDNRISYGCINVPPGFYENVVRTLFRSTAGVVYILPETRSVEDVFFADASR